MNGPDFEAVVEEMIGMSRDLLMSKNAAYNPDADKLETFKIAAALKGETPAQALWGMAVKHLVAVNKMVKSGEFYPDEVWNEKLGDSLNYFVLLRAVVADGGSIGDRPLTLNQTIINNYASDGADPSAQHDLSIPTD